MAKVVGRWAALLVVLCACQCAQAGLLPAKADALHSAVLGQDRPIEVYLPEESLKDPAQRFETLYVLDGDWNARIVTQVVDFMRQLGMLPPMIVVGIPNPLDAKGRNSRDHDLTPTSLADEPNSGGAPAFLQFLKSELLPYVSQHYPANGVNLVHGHSYGGLFLVYALASDPTVFDGYIVLDPAMWWDKGAVTATLGKQLGGVPTARKALYIAGRGSEGFKQMGIDDLEEAFKRHAPPALHWTVGSFEGESHDSMKLKATYDGLKYLYDGYTQDVVELSPTEGIVEPGKPIRMFVSGHRIRVRYTQDGSEPTEASAADEQGAITIDQPEKARIKLVSNRGVFDRALPLALKTGVALAPRKANRRDSPDAQWSYAVYPAEAWAHMASGKAVSRGSGAGPLDFGKTGLKGLVLRANRRIFVPEDGYYVFFVNADKVRLRLNGALLMGGDEPTGHRTRSYLAPLRRGFHDLEVEALREDEGRPVNLGVIHCSDPVSAWWLPEPWMELGGR